MTMLGTLVSVLSLMVLSTGWWIVMPLYLGSYRSKTKPPTRFERGFIVVAGVFLALAWVLVTQVSI